MFRLEYPLFEKNQILKSEMLECLRDYPLKMMEIYGSEYGDGIIAGCNISWDEGSLILSPGAICYHHRIYLMDKEIRVATPQDGRLKYLKVHFWAPEKEPDKVKAVGRVLLEEIPVKSGEVEICRFCLQSGARLRCEYVDFDDYATEFNTVNRINVPYSYKGGSSFWPKIIHTFSEEMIQRQGLEHPIDSSFVMSCLCSNEPIPLMAIKGYLKAREGLQAERFVQSELYQELRTILMGRHEIREVINMKKKVFLI